MSAISSVMVMSALILKMRVSLLVGVGAAADFAHLRGLASVGEGNVNCYSVLVVSGLSSEVIEFVGSCNYLS